MTTKLIISLVLISTIAAAPIPNIIFHGFGDSCNFPGMAEFTHTIKQKTSAYTKCIKIGIEQQIGGILIPMPTQVKTACKEIEADSNFQGTVNVIGLSQGGLLARSVVEQCNLKGRVHRLLSIGGPQMGVAAFPNCEKGIVCTAVTWGLDQIVYLPEIADITAPAGYFKDPKDYDKYLKESIYLPDLNNEKDQKNVTYKNRILDLDRIMLVMFTEDTVIYPRETAWFGYFDSKMELLKMEDTDLYKDDYIGLKELNVGKKIEFVSIKGNHLQFTKKDIENTFIPFLTGNGQEQEQYEEQSFLQ